MRGSAEEANRTGRRKLRRSAGIAFGALLFLLLTVSPSRGTVCSGPSLAFANLPDGQFLQVSPGDAVTIVGQFWTHDCFGMGGGGPCHGPGNERPMRNIDVELARPVTTVAVLAEGLSAGGGDQSWSLTFRVPELPAGSYRIYAHDGEAEGAPKLFLRVSGEAPG